MSVRFAAYNTDNGVLLHDGDAVLGMEKAADIMNYMSNKIAELEKGYKELQVATLNAIQVMGGGQAKADLRDAYDKATELNGE